MVRVRDHSHVFLHIDRFRCGLEILIKQGAWNKQIKKMHESNKF